jgi:glycosyltransferase involved in cell wall biosynthesis
MKILIVSQYFYPENFKVNDIAFDFVKKGHDVTVFTAKPNYPHGKFFKGYSFFGRSKEIINGVNVIRIPVIPRFNSKAIFLVLNYLSFVFFSFIFKYRVKGKYDVIFCNAPSPVTAAVPAVWFKKKCHSKLYVWVLDIWPESVQAILNLKDGFILKKLEDVISYIYKNTDVILISSNSHRISVLQKIEDKEKPIKFFPNWAEDVFAKPINENDLKKIPEFPDGFNIVFAGNIGDAQDFESILEAAKLTQDKAINWVLVGDGRKLKWIKDEIITHKIKNVFPMGNHPLETMPLFFAKADVMLVSLKNNPAFSVTIPAKVQAYMASSKIILGMLDGDGNDLISKSGCGFVVDAGDFVALSQKAIQIKNLPREEIQRIEKKTKKYYDENFSKEYLFNFLEENFKT